MFGGAVSTNYFVGYIFIYFAAASVKITFAAVA
jgi:hypothetical protein